MSVQIGNIDLGEFPLLLAPMEDVSDPPFRKLCKALGADMVSFGVGNDRYALFPSSSALDLLTSQFMGTP